MFEIEHISSRQEQRYGDFFRKYRVKSDEPIQQVAADCLHYFGRDIPAETEWKQNIRIGGAHDKDMGYYFAGYYSLTVIGTDEGITEYLFKVTEPFAD